MATWNRAITALVGVCLYACAQAASAAEAPLMPYQEYEKRIKSAQAVSPLTSDLFGDQVSLYNGSTELSATDIDLPGNDALPVRLGRRWRVESKKDIQLLGGFGLWDIDIPYIHGTFADYWGPPQGGGGRCSNFGPPPYVGVFDATDFWSGSLLHVPGQGDQEILRIGNPGGLHERMQAPADGHSYLLGTKGFHRIRCKSATANGFGGEGFIVVDSSGTTTTFDVGVVRDAGSMEKPAGEHGNGVLGRFHVYLMPSLMEDRFGNRVTFNWSGDKLQSITASDGRYINLIWSAGRIVAATSSIGTWNYDYSSGMLRVVQPDGAAWTYTHAGLPWPLYPLTDYPTSDARCNEPFPAYDAYWMQITHPSGAVGRFDFQLTRHRRNGIPESACVHYYTQPGTGEKLYQMAIPDYFDVFTLYRKQLSGPGLTPQEWLYEYEVIDNGRAPMEPWMPLPCATCQDAKSVTVHQPDGTQVEYRFGILWNGNDGRLLATYTRDPTGRILRSEVNQYMSNAQAQGMPFPDVYGYGYGDDGTTNEIRPVNSVVVRQDGPIPAPTSADQSSSADSFSRQTTAFDAFARPTRTVRASSVGHSAEETRVYYDDLGRWVLGQMERAATDGVESSRTQFNGNSQPWKTYGFGLLQHTLAYHADGTLASVTDGRNLTTTLTQWKRGIPQLIQNPDLTTKVAQVDDAGRILSTTDELGSRTCYGYDPMGRIALVTPPSETTAGTCDTSAWNATSIRFESVASSEYGIPAGHWRRTEETGTARKLTYFDALWRPIVEEVVDTTDLAGTNSWIARRYDFKGQPVFVSYPRNLVQGGWVSWSAVNDGTHTSYDPLGRVERVEQDSELGRLATSIQYLPGFIRSTTSPKGQVTTQHFQVFDEPSYERPTVIYGPEGTRTTIARDVFGKPRAMTRDGGG